MRNYSPTDVSVLVWPLNFFNNVGDLDVEGVVSVSSRPHFEIATFQLNVTEWKFLVC